MDPAKDEMVTLAEVFLTAEMVAAGIEAMHEARTNCLEEGDLIIEIYLAMYGMAIKCIAEEPEPVHWGR